LRNWVESQCTWLSYSSGNNWQSAGCYGANDREATAIGSISLIAGGSGGENTITLDAAMVQEWVKGTIPNYGMVFQYDAQLNDQHVFASSDNATASYRPKLVIEWELPSGVSGV